VPSLAGQRKLLASLDCEQLTQVHGVLNILVEENKGVSLAGVGLTFMAPSSTFRERIMKKKYSLALNNTLER